ncbi:MAG: hypothetical protein ACPHM2_01920, partial [Alcanivorax sp.]
RLAGRLEGVDLVPTAGIVEGLRVAKEPGEIDLIRDATRIADATQKSHGQYRDQLAEYFAHLTDESLTRTQAGKRLAAIPVAGPRAIALLGEAVRETGTAFVDQLVDDLASPANRQQLEQLLHDLIGAAKGEGEQLDQLIRDTLMDVLEQVKAQIAVQQWKLEEQDGPEKS